MTAFDDALIVEIRKERRGGLIEIGTFRFEGCLFTTVGCVGKLGRTVGRLELDSVERIEAIPSCPVLDQRSESSNPLSSNRVRVTLLRRISDAFVASEAKN